MTTLRVSCALCRWHWTGDPAEALERGTRHREAAHGLILRQRSRRIGVCGVFTCNQPAVKRVQGRGLCPEHLEAVQARAAARGWTTAIGGRIGREAA